MNEWTSSSFHYSYADGPSSNQHPKTTGQPCAPPTCSHSKLVANPRECPPPFPWYMEGNRIEKQSTQPESHGWQVVAQGSNKARPSSSASVSETAHFCGAGRRITNTGQCKGKHITDLGSSLGLSGGFSTQAPEE